MRYITICSKYPIDFDREVNAHLRMGWELFGFQTNHVQPNGMIYIQVMIKYDEENENDN